MFDTGFKAANSEKNEIHYLPRGLRTGRKAYEKVGSLGTREFNYCLLLSLLLFNWSETIRRFNIYMALFLCPFTFSMHRSTYEGKIQIGEIYYDKKTILSS